jgi:ubiquinone biosynthesis protein COQ4
VLFACDTSVLGELALKAVEALQTGMPSAALAAVAGPLRLPRRRRAAYAAVYLPWALRAGSRASDLLCIRYEKHFPEPIDELRTRWRVEAAPARAQALALAAEPRG